MALSQNQYGGSAGTPAYSDLSAWYSTQGRGALGDPGSTDYMWANKLYNKAHAPAPAAPIAPTNGANAPGSPGGTAGTLAYGSTAPSAPGAGGNTNPFSPSPMGGGGTATGNSSAGGATGGYNNAGGTGYSAPVVGGGYPSQGSLPAPYALGNTPGADTAYQTLTNQLSSLNNPMLSGANAVMNTAFDPQNALYNRTQQQLQDQVRVGQAARGITSSPYGAGLENQAMSNFDIDWQNAQLGRQTQGLGAAQSSYGQSAQNTQSSVQDWLNYMNQAQSGYGNQFEYYGLTKPPAPTSTGGGSYGSTTDANQGLMQQQQQFNDMMNQYKQLYPG